MDQLNPSGDQRFTATVPPGLGGHTISFRAYAIGPTGRVVDSDDELITFL